MKKIKFIIVILFITSLIWFDFSNNTQEIQQENLELQKQAILLKDQNQELQTYVESLENEKLELNLRIAQLENQLDNNKLTDYNPFVPFISVSLRTEDTNEVWVNSIMSSFSEEPIIGEGYIDKPVNKKWTLEVYNKGMVEIEDIEINYTINTYKHEIEYGIDKTDIKSYKPVIYKTVTKTIKISKLIPGEKKEFDVIYMGTFPMIDLNINSITSSNNVNFIEGQYIYYYYFNEFRELQDSPHLRQLLGL